MTAKIINFLDRMPIETRLAAGNRAWARYRNRRFQAEKMRAHQEALLIEESEGFCKED
jgi:hypothetical protein